MTRIKISIAILALLISSGIFSVVSISESCGELIGIVDTMQRLTDEKDNAQAERVSEDFLSEWKDFRRFARAAVRNDKLSEIERIGIRIKNLIAEESDETPAELAELRCMLELIRDGEKGIIRGIF